MIPRIAAHLGDASPQAGTLFSVSQLLTIMKVEHYVMRQPEFILKPTLEAIVMQVLSSMGVKSKEEVDYESLLEEVFYYDRAD